MTWREGAPSRRIPQQTVAVVGAGYLNRDRSDRRFEILLCTAGELVELRPEPRNRFDERAVAVFSCRGVQIGYLPAERCGRIGHLIRQGCELRAIFQARAKFGAWVRISFDGEPPILPPNKIEIDTIPMDWAE